MFMNKIKNGLTVLKPMETIGQLTSGVILLFLNTRQYFFFISISGTHLRYKRELNPMWLYTYTLYIACCFVNLGAEVLIIINTSVCPPLSAVLFEASSETLSLEIKSTQDEICYLDLICFMLQHQSGLRIRRAYKQKNMEVI